jgi:hypothetical protein
VAILAVSIVLTLLVSGPIGNLRLDRSGGRRDLPSWTCAAASRDLSDGKGFW